jgi:hypothetical protein
MARTGILDVGQYAIHGNGPDQARRPRPGDQHVVVDRFSERLPEVLYQPEFLDRLRLQFPVEVTAGFNENKRQYVRVLQFVTNYLFPRRAPRRQRR